MEFRNLTPFHAMAFNAVDVTENEFHVVVLKAAYSIESSHLSGADGDTHRCVLQEGDAAVSLAMADEYEGVGTDSSIKCESDLAPFKAKCDFVIRATSHAPNGMPARWWPVRVRVNDGDAVVIDKCLKIFGPRTFREDWRGWRISEAEPCNEVAIRWEYAYGGTSVVVSDAGAPGDADGLLLREVCFTNPLGCGWLEERYFKLARGKGVLASPDVLSAPAELARIMQLRAPQIEAWDCPVLAPDVVRHPGVGLDARQMAAVADSYRLTPVGLGFIGRAWTPRLQRAGTYDAAWQETTWPHLPKDFDFGYWNGAPEDQQIPWPRPGLGFELTNLARPEDTRSGVLRARLPGHRALAALRYVSGTIAPVEMRLDTVLVDTSAMQVSLTWRAVFPLQPEVRVCEARFETDPAAPLLRFRQDNAQTEKEAAWQTT